MQSPERQSRVRSSSPTENHSFVRVAGNVQCNLLKGKAVCAALHQPKTIHSCAWQGTCSAISCKAKPCAQLFTNRENTKCQWHRSCTVCAARIQGPEHVRALPFEIEAPEMCQLLPKTKQRPSAETGASAPPSRGVPGPGELEDELGKLHRGLPPPSAPCVWICAGNCNEGGTLRGHSSAGNTPVKHPRLSVTNSIATCGLKRRLRHAPSNFM